ncbi:MAG: hypothetical protein HZA89_01010 [Verrucomicrobia bacterium]|nr:hypothetical protein [Verrucomicrobiota bacterium]
MPQQAQVTSLDALETFRAQLLVYLTKARAATDDVMGDVTRTRAWVQSDQRRVLEAQLHRRTKELEQAQQELLSSRVSQLKEASSAQVMAVTRARRALDAAQDKLAVLKKWNRRYDNEVSLLAKPVDRLRGFLAKDLREAVFSLEQTLRTLDDYASRGGFGPPNPPVNPGKIPAEAGGELPAKIISESAGEPGKLGGQIS